jgi:hypothetical protein
MRALCARLLCLAICLPAFAAGLEVVDPVVAQFDGGPKVPEEYAFREGESIFFRFDVAGYKAAGEEDRNLHLAWECKASDPQGVLLTKPESGEVRAGLAEEDKNWKPRVRLEIPLPFALLTGSGELTIHVQDKVSGATTTKKVPFRMRGLDTGEGKELRAARFRFFRSEEATQPLSIPAYSPGDTVWAKFLLAGYALGKENEYDIAYGLEVFRANGESIYKQEEAARDAAKTFYPKRYVEGALSLNLTKDLSKGEYTILVRLNDHVGAKTAESRYVFRVE